MTLEELALMLCHRMVFRRPVWVDSPAGQEVRIAMVSLDEGELIAWDEDGNDRPVSHYLLKDPRDRP